MIDDVEMLEKIKYLDGINIKIGIESRMKIRNGYEKTMVSDWAHIRDELIFSNAGINIKKYFLSIYYWSDILKGLKEHWLHSIYLTCNDIPKQKVEMDFL